MASRRRTGIGRGLDGFALMERSRRRVMLCGGQRFRENARTDQLAEAEGSEHGISHASFWNQSVVSDWGCGEGCG